MITFNFFVFFFCFTNYRIHFLLIKVVFDNYKLAFSLLKWRAKSILHPVCRIRECLYHLSHLSRWRADVKEAVSRCVLQTTAKGTQPVVMLGRSKTALTTMTRKYFIVIVVGRLTEMCFFYFKSSAMIMMMISYEFQRAKITLSKMG